MPNEIKALLTVFSDNIWVRTFKGTTYHRGTWFPIHHFVVVRSPAEWRLIELIDSTAISDPVVSLAQAIST